MPKTSFFRFQTRGPARVTILPNNGAVSGVPCCQHREGRLPHSPDACRGGVRGRLRSQVAVLVRFPWQHTAEAPNYQVLSAVLRVEALAHVKASARTRDLHWGRSKFGTAAKRIGVRMGEGTFARGT